METGFRATFVISWAQTETDGLCGASHDQMILGSSWRWRGTALRLDVPLGPLVLAPDGGAAHDRLWAAAMVRQLLSAAIAHAPVASIATLLAGIAAEDAPQDGFVVTDGLRTHALTVIVDPASGARLCMCEGGMPPVDTDLWVTRMALQPAPAIPKKPEAPAGVICFGPGTRLSTPGGARAIEDLRPGDLVSTKDNGPQEILWTGHRRLSGARLHAMPHLRPVRFRSGALGIGQPDGDLVVSPQHRMVVRSQAALDLFRTDEVMVAAEHLLNGRSVTLDRDLRDVTYFHVLLGRHNVIWANGLETESFHPAHMDLATLNPDQFDGLMGTLPDLRADPRIYGPDARRTMTAPEAARLRHALAA
ncbi:MAG: Hint domain-containing protein [Pseudomonadota bacterium]